MCVDFLNLSRVRQGKHPLFVLLILAAISVSMLTGDNSILKQVGVAKDVTGEKEIEEKIKIAYLGAIDKNTGSINRRKFEEELDNTFGAGKYTLSTDGSTITIDGKDYDTGLPGKWSNTEKTAMTNNNISELTGDAIDNDNLKDTTKIKAVIKDEDNAQIPIPIDAEYVEGKESTGVVIKYKKSEFVWVPVPVTAGNSLYVKGTTKPMAKKQQIRMQTIEIITKVLYMIIQVQHQLKNQITDKIQQVIENQHIYQEQVMMIIQHMGDCLLQMSYSRNIIR